MRVRLMLAASALALSVLAAVGLTGCGQSGGPTEYLWKHGTRVVFVAWQRSSSGHLTGLITTDFAIGVAPGETVTSESATFSGTPERGGFQPRRESDPGRSRPRQRRRGSLRRDSPPPDGRLRR